MQMASAVVTNKAQSNKASTPVPVMVSVTISKGMKRHVFAFFLVEWRRWGTGYGDQIILESGVSDCREEAVFEWVSDFPFVERKKIQII